MAGDGIVTTPNTVELAAVPVIPGATVMLVVSTADAGEKEVSVPVLPPGSDQDYYDGITP